MIKHVGNKERVKCTFCTSHEHWYIGRTLIVTSGSGGGGAPTPPNGR